MRVPGKVRQLQYLELLGREGVEGLLDLVALRVPQGLRKGLARLGAWGRGFDLFLRPVLRGLTFPHHPVGKGEGCAAVTVIQRRKRLGVSRLDQGDQILVSKY